MTNVAFFVTNDSLFKLQYKFIKCSELFLKNLQVQILCYIYNTITALFSLAGLPPIMGLLG